MVEDLREELRCRCGVDLQAGLAEGVLRHGQGVTVRVQIASVLQQQRDQSIGLFSRPALFLRLLAKAPFMLDPLAHTAAHQGAAEGVSPTPIEPEQAEQLDDLLGVQELACRCGPEHSPTDGWG